MSYVLMTQVNVFHNKSLFCKHVFVFRNMCVFATHITVSKNKCLFLRQLFVSVLISTLTLNHTIQGKIFHAKISYFAMPFHYKIFGQFVHVF